MLATSSAATVLSVAGRIRQKLLTLRDSPRVHPETMPRRVNYVNPKWEEEGQDDEKKEGGEEEDDEEEEEEVVVGG